MRSLLRSVLKIKLKFLARATFWKYRPFVVGITGSVGKTSTKLATLSVLSAAGSVRAAGGNLNNEFGLPLAVLGDYRTPGGASFWAGVMTRGFLGLFVRQSYPRVLVLEYGADRPGDLDHLLSIVRPNVAVVTAIGETPVHVEFYGGPEDVAKEKSKLVSSVGENGWVVLNYDDPEVLSMREAVKCRVKTFGFGEGADVRIAAFENRSEFGKPVGISFKLEVNGSFVPVKIEGMFGKAQAYAAAAAAAVGLTQGLNLVEISGRLALYRGERGRTRLIEGVKGTYIIDDTYNASPASVLSALEILRSLSSPRKVAVLGDMAELGRYTLEAHENVGRVAAGVVDFLVTVGPKARFIAEGARKGGFSGDRIASFDEAKTAAPEVQKLLAPKDVVLVKGSQSMRMETVVLEIMARPELAKELLVRQYGKWLKM
jgi:UDP-N-acetylmuramoyl-tripeptide--D-alanyl-D-alanine ligase